MSDKKNDKNNKKATAKKTEKKIEKAPVSEKAKKPEKKSLKKDKMFDLSQNRILRLVTLAISAICVVWGIIAFFLHIADNEVLFMNFAIYFILFFVVASIALGVGKKIVAIINAIALVAIISIAFATPIFYIYTSLPPVDCVKAPCPSVSYEWYNYFGINWKS